MQQKRMWLWKETWSIYVTYVNHLFERTNTYSTPTPLISRMNDVSHEYASWVDTWSMLIQLEFLPLEYWHVLVSTVFVCTWGSMECCLPAWAWKRGEKEADVQREAETKDPRVKLRGLGLVSDIFSIPGFSFLPDSAVLLALRLYEKVTMS